MKRRNVLKSGATALLSIPFLSIKFQNKPYPAWILELIKINDTRLEHYKKIRVSDVSNNLYGAYFDDAEIINAQTTSSFIALATMLFSNSESKYYYSNILLKEIEDAALAILKLQHTDGTIDLLSTNFHSPPDTAFVLENILPAYSYLNTSKEQNIERSLEALKAFALRAGEALLVGGIHTPNHRWVVCGALARLNSLFPNQKYLTRTNQWLAEHIDIDLDGQYTEKSTQVYSPIVNRSLIIMAQYFSMPELLDHVRKNLLMTMYYVHPNGDIVTEASSRQDKGVLSTVLPYYFAYRYFAILDNNKQMAAMCKHIEATTSKEQMASYVGYFLENPIIWKDLPIASTIPTSYVKEFPYSGIVRIRREEVDATILSKNNSFITIHKTKTAIQAIRVASSFFGIGQFQTEKIERENDVWVLRSTLEGPYFQPHNQKDIDPNGIMQNMPRNLRKQSEIQKLNYTVKIKELNGGIEIDFDIEGTDNVPVTLELIFREGGEFENVQKVEKKENAYLLSRAYGIYKKDNESIRFGPGIVKHKGLTLQGALGPMGLPTVYLTAFTPFKHTLHIS